MSASTGSVGCPYMNENPDLYLDTLIMHLDISAHVQTSPSVSGSERWKTQKENYRHLATLHRALKLIYILMFIKTVSHNTQFVTSQYLTSSLLYLGSITETWEYIAIINVHLNTIFLDIHL